MRNVARVALLMASSFFAIAATGRCKPEPQPKPPHDWTLADVPETAIVIHPADLAAQSAFQLRNVLSEIIRTGGGTPGNGAEEALLKTLLDSSLLPSKANPASGLVMRMEVRPAEAAQDPAALLDPATGMVPVGLFNRLDAMPADASDCGEYRIAYASRDNNFLLIFEAKMPNRDAKGNVRDEKECARLAHHWANVAAAPDAERWALLRRLYFEGVEGFPAVVRAAHYGDKLGQVRSNSIRQSPNWQLREWRVGPMPGGVRFDIQPVASNPLAEFYQDNNAGTLNPGLPLQESERRRFHDEFVNQYSKQLVDADSRLPADMAHDDLVAALLANVGARVELAFNEFESNAGGTMGSGSTLGARLNDFTSPVGDRSVSKAELFARAGAMTCGGCHSFSNNARVGTVDGQPLTWPSSDGFRHIRFAESAPAPLSDLLTTAFIPFRQRAMVTFLNKHHPETFPTLTARRAPQTMPSPLFQRIVASRQIVATDRAAYDRQADALRIRDIRTPGLFRRNRAPH